MKQLIFLTVFFFMSIEVFPQFDILKKVQDKVKEKTEKKVEETIDTTIDNAGKKKENQQTPEGQVETEQTNANQEKVVTNTGKEEFTSYSKFDFIPGEQIIFYDDFSQDNIGDFPALWNTNGSGEVVNTNLYPGNWLQFSSRNAIWTDNLLNLPENYTIEFDVVPIKGEEGSMAGYGFRLMQSINAKSFDYGSVPGKAAFSFYVEYFGRPGYRTYINGDEGQGLGLNGIKENKDLYQKENKKYHISVWVQKSRVRIYQDETKMFDLPKAFPLSSVKMDRIRFEDGAALVSNIRIAVGAPDMRSKLITEGKLVTRGILFDVNSDKIKPESFGTLKEIAKVLQDNASVKVKIVGHTDNDGSDESNLDLSKRRSISVKNSLSTEFGIDAARMETDGKGETEPVSDNNTPEGKANNRRVEFIKL
ncbi:MAG TPA: OmpA family protein [Ignavibacteriaceae bacterium]|nr:OmpA family protein [Ignavibacteriaceae bacterium]